jgi:acetyl-CoA C-acetyltransferase
MLAIFASAQGTRNRIKVSAPTPLRRSKALRERKSTDWGSRCQQKAANAIKHGHFDNSLVPVYQEDGSLALDREEYPRPQTTLEGLAGLKPAFAAVADYPLDDKGTTYRNLILQKYPDLDIDFMHHAGNSSGVVDGSAAVLLASPNYAKAHGLKPRARVVAMANMGDSPTLMLNAPVPAAHKVLAKAGLTLDDIDLFEINEAFAVVLRNSFGTSISTAVRSMSTAGRLLWVIRSGRRAQF